MTFALGLAAMAAVLYWLYRKKAQDLDDCVDVLGLQRATRRVETNGTSVEGFAYHQSLLLEGTLEGQRAELSVRTVKRVPNRVRRHGSQLTVLALDTGSKATGRFRLQPAGMMRLLEDVQHGAPPIVATGDADFDAAYRLYADDGTVPSVLDAQLRRAILELRAQVGGALPDNVAGAMASALVLGSFEVEPGTVRYVLFGSPIRAVAEHLRKAAPLMVRLGSAR